MYQTDRCNLRCCGGKNPDWAHDGTRGLMYIRPSVHLEKPVDIALGLKEGIPIFLGLGGWACGYPVGSIFVSIHYYQAASGGSLGAMFLALATLFRQSELQTRGKGLD